MLKVLSELSSIHYGKSPSDVIDEDGEIPIVGTGGIYGNAIKAMFQNGIVVPRKGSLGNPQVYLKPFWPVDTTYALIPTKNTDIKWLYYCLLIFDLRKLNEATGVPSISREWLSKIRIFTPEQPHQQKIATILSTIDRAIENTEALIEKYQQIKTGLMHDLFTRGIGEDGKLRPPRAEAPELYKEMEIGWIPREWGVDKIGNLFQIQLGKMLNKDAKTGKCSAAYLGNKNVQWEKVDLSNLEQMDFSPTERKKYNLLAGDLLVCEGGEVGRTAIWSNELIECYYQKAIHRLRPLKGNVLPEIMLRIMLFASRNRYFSDFTSQSSIAHLTQEKLSLIKIFLPSINEQKLMLIRFAKMDDSIDLGLQHLDKLQHQKTGLMHDLLTGKVEVTV